MAYPDLGRLAVCRDFLEDEIVRRLMRVVRLIDDAEDDAAELAAAQSALAGALVERAEKEGLCGDILSACLLRLLADGGNTAARTVEACGSFGSGIQKALEEDLELLRPYFDAQTSAFTGCSYLDDYKPSRPSSSRYEKELAARLAQKSPARAVLSHYKKYGSGMLARFTAFRILDDGTMAGIENFPVFAWKDLIGYEAQKEKLMLNTRAFVEGKPANNVLLTGARGTGKSTGVKSLASYFKDRGLRLVQLHRNQMDCLAQVMEQLGRIKSKRFILFFDDLSFDEGEAGYKYLKSAIDGSVTAQPDNVLIYATSNRRHILKETWQDRSDEIAAEVFRQDSANESISLSDRFGLILHYHDPSQEEYLKIIENELKKAGVKLPPKKLRIEALRWEMEHSGRNGRIASQFVKWYIGTEGRRREEEEQGDISETTTATGLDEL